MYSSIAEEISTRKSDFFFGPSQIIHFVVYPIDNTGCGPKNITQDYFDTKSLIVWEKLKKNIAELSLKTHSIF